MQKVDSANLTTVTLLQTSHSYLYRKNEHNRLIVLLNDNKLKNVEVVIIKLIKPVDGIRTC